MVSRSIVVLDLCPAIELQPFSNDKAEIRASGALAIAAAVQATPVQRVVVKVVGADERAPRDETTAQCHPPGADDGGRRVGPSEEVQIVELLSRSLQPRTSGNDRQFDALAAGQVENRLALKVGERKPDPFVGQSIDKFVEVTLAGRH